MKGYLYTSIATEVQAEPIQFQTTVSRPTSSVSEALLLIFFGLSALGAIGTFLTKEFHKKRDEQELKGKLAKIPCPGCQYFSKSSYLRCAVQPKLTMTNEAMECPDFNPPCKD
jgi:hypothetical protein